MGEGATEVFPGRSLSYSGQNTTKEYGIEAYCEQLRKWMFDTQCWYAYHHQNVINWTINQQYGYTLGQFLQMGNHSNNETIESITVIQQPNGQRVMSGRFRYASYVRRFMAELIDFIFAFVIKLLVVYSLVELEFIDITRFDKLLSNEVDLQTLVDVTQELFPLEILGKLVCSILEASCISHGISGLRFGCTPGKYLLGIRVIGCTSVASISGGSPEYIQVTGPITVPFKYALLRSLLKNLLVNSLVPFSSVAFAFSHNRSLYDIAAKTIVVYF